MVKLYALFLKSESPEDVTQHVETVLVPLLKQVRDFHHLAVTRIDGAPVGDGRPGPLTREIASRFTELVSREAAPA